MNIDTIIQVGLVAQHQLHLNGNTEASLFSADRPFQSCHAYHWCRTLALACQSYDLDPIVVARAAVGRRSRLVGPFFSASDIERYRFLCENARSSAAAAAMGAAIEVEQADRIRLLQERQDRMNRLYRFS